MANTNTAVSGALVTVNINGKIYNESQSVSWSIGNSLKEVYGIDFPFPQEIITGQQTITGNISGLVVGNSGGLQGADAEPLVGVIFSSPYISIRVRNRATGESMIFVPEAMVGDRNYSVSARGMMTLSFSFKGIVPYQALDEV